MEASRGQALPSGLIVWRASFEVILHRGRPHASSRCPPFMKPPEGRTLVGNARCPPYRRSFNISRTPIQLMEIGAASQVVVAKGLSARNSTCRRSTFHFRRSVSGAPNIRASDNSCIRNHQFMPRIHKPESSRPTDLCDVSDCRFQATKDRRPSCNGDIAVPVPDPMSSNNFSFGRIVRSATTFAIVATVSGVASAALPTVYVNGTAFYSQDFWNYSWNTGDQYSGPPLPPAFFKAVAQKNALARAMRDTGDVRCSILEEIRSTVSTADVTSRMWAARKTYDQMALLTIGNAEIGKSGILAITYADGGTERWLIKSPVLPGGGIEDPEARSLILGNGTPQPSPNLACRLLK